MLKAEMTVNCPYCHKTMKIAFSKESLKAAVEKIEKGERMLNITLKGQRLNHRSVGG